MTRQEYLQRPLLKGVIYKITPDWVFIYDSYTIFIECRRCEIVPLAEVEKLYRQLVKEARKTENLKLKGVTKFLPAVRTLFPQYLEAVSAINRHFSDIVEIAEKVRSDGIHSGYRDDDVLSEAFRRGYAIQKVYYRSSPYSRFLEYYDRLKQITEERVWEDGATSSTIFLA